jgi:signal transduction histidine kinase/DNA-binding response OmpR family regulator/ligand-binding sensor domain-containing protein
MRRDLNLTYFQSNKWIVLKSMVLLFILSGEFIAPAFSQPQGKLIIQNYDLVDIGSSNGAFWSAAQDHRGFLYFGGEQAVFEFDGTTWRKIELPNKSVVRSLAVDKNGVIYVGGVSEFGYLSADEAGNSIYVSLIEKIPEDTPEFPDIWSINVTDDAVYFNSAGYLFIYKNDKITTLRLDNSYHRSIAVNNRLIINQENTGLCYVRDGKIINMPGGEFFIQKIISSIVDYGSGKLLIGTREQGLFIYHPTATDGNKIKSLKSEASDFLIENQLYHGIELPDDRYAFATLHNGVIITDRAGNILNLINKMTGAVDNVAYFLNLTNNTELWITTGRGISLFNIYSALNYWDEDMGVKGSANCIIEYKNTIYTGTNAGMYIMDLDPDHERFQTGRFKRMDGAQYEVWEFLLFNPYPDQGNDDNQQLIAATREGLFSVDKQKIVFKTNRIGHLNIFHSKKNPSLVYLNAHPTFYILQYQNGVFEPIWEKEISTYVTSITEDKYGDVWLGTRYYGLFRIGLEDFFSTLSNRQTGPVRNYDFSNIKIENYTKDEKSNAISNVQTHLYRGELIISSQGIYSFNRTRNELVKTDMFGEEIKNGEVFLTTFKEDSYDNIWGVGNKVLDKQTNGQFRVVDLPYRILTIQSASNNFYHDNRGLTWIIGEQAVLRYKSINAQMKQKNSFSTFIRKVIIGEDSILFGGAHTLLHDDKVLLSNDQPDSLVSHIKFKEQSIAFNYACPYFHDDIPLEYSIFLEGYDKKWSEWSYSTTKEYSNLRENTYIFRARARNYAGEISQEASYKFIISPPWYRTFVAYLLYFLSILSLIYIAIRVYVHRLKKSNINLERQVAQRTSELERQKEEINNQAIKLKTQNDRLINQRNWLSEMSKEILKTNRDKLKFFTNISHELRTPLTLILGPIEELSDESQQLSKEERQSKYNTIIKNARRLLALVNQILEIRKLENSKPSLSASKGDIVKFTFELTSYFKEISNKKEIHLIFNPEEKEMITWFDADKVSKILFNLLSNAFKFTEPGGEIKVSIHSGEMIDEGQKTISIAVTDSGIGIDKEMLKKIFERYFHSNRSLSLEQAGSGIGLNMAASLAEIHKGKIDVESEVGKGSTFTLSIPFGESYLNENEKEINEEVQDIFHDLNFKAKLETINQLNITVRKKKTEPDENSDKELVLIVDDSEDIRSYIIKEIRNKYDYIEAENGEEGFDSVMNYNPAIIISDIMMPVMDGNKLCVKIKSTLETSHIPVIMLTSKSTDEDRRQGIQIGADAYITKPFNIKILLATIENLLQSRKRLKERFSKNLTYKSNDIVITPSDEKFITKALEILDANLSDVNFGVEEFAKEMAMSQSTLYRKLKALSDESTNNFIKDFRLRKAAEIMVNHELNVNEVSLMVGINDSAYFAKIFKAKFGDSPTEYVKKNKPDH